MGTVYYKWLNPFNGVWSKTRCRVVSHTDKTAKIELLEFGKNGTPPGTILKRVHLSSLVGFEVPKPDGDEPEWHKYAYFD